MIDLTQITFEQANIIECVLSQMETRIYDNYECYEKLACDTTFSDTTRECMNRNAKWWLTAYQLIFGNDINKGE